jgi:hypothetical protein
MANHHSKRQTIYKWRTFQSNLARTTCHTDVNQECVDENSRRNKIFPNLFINPIDGQMLSSCQNLLATQCYPLVNKHVYGKSPFLMVQSTVSMAIFNSFLLVYQAGYIMNSQFFDG